MKTKVNTVTLAMFFVVLAAIILQAGITAAGNPKMVAGLKPVFVVTNLAPVTPKVADFNDNALGINEPYAALQPVAPKEASFEDSGMDAYESWNLIRTLKPELPAEADYTDAN